MQVLALAELLSNCTALGKFIDLFREDTELEGILEVSVVASQLTQSNLC